MPSCFSLSTSPCFRQGLAYIKAHTAPAAAEIEAAEEEEEEDTLPSAAEEDDGNGSSSPIQNNIVSINGNDVLPTTERKNINIFNWMS